MTHKVVYLLFFIVALNFPTTLLALDTNDPNQSLSDSLSKEIKVIYKTTYYDDFEATLKSLDKILQIAGDSGLLEVKLSAIINKHYCAQYHGRVDQMIQYLEEARLVYDQNNSLLEENTRNNLQKKLLYASGNAAYQFGNYQEAIQEFEQILKIDSLSSGYLYKCFSYLGHSYTNLENYPKAIDYHIQALDQLSAKKKHNYYRGLSNSYLGITYKKMWESKLDSTLLRTALKYYLKSLSFFNQSDKKVKTGPISCYNLLSEAYGILDQPDSSLYFLQKATSVDPENTETLRFWGMYYNRLGKYEKARSCFSQSSEIIAKTKGPNHYLIGRNLVQIGKQHNAENNWEEAIKNYQMAFSYFRSQDLKLDDLSSSSYINNIISFRDFFDCVRLKAKAQLEWSRDSSSSDEDRIKRLIGSISTYEIVIKLIDEQRTRYVSSKYQEIIGAKALSVYEQAISACYDAINSGLDSERYTALAFYFMEKNKNRELRNALNLQGNVQYAGVPKTILEEEYQLKSKLRYYNRLLYNEKQKPQNIIDNKKIQLLQQESFDLDNQLETLGKRLSHNYPAYQQLKNGEPTIGLEELKEKIGKNTLLLEYFYGDQEAYVFVVGSDHIHFEKLVAINELEPILKTALHESKKPSNRNKPSEVYFKNLYTLKNRLIPDAVYIPIGVTQLVIVPDGPLGYLPYEMLVTKDAVTPRFLIEDFTIHYTYSSYLVGEKLSLKKSKYEYIGFAPSYNSLETDYANEEKNYLGALAFNTKEVQSANSLFDGLSFLDTAGTESKFRQYSHSTNILHLSMHALVNDEQPEYSKLIFHPSKDPLDSTELDGNLHLYELLSQPLRAQLTVLSACNTGNGKLSRGEGISSLGRAFRYAGCNSIVMSLWEANDKHTQYLIDRFFNHLKSGLDKDEALRHAKLDFLSNPSHKYFKHPFYWSSLVLIGEPSKLHFQKDYKIPFVLLFLLFLVGPLLYYFNKQIRA